MARYSFDDSEDPFNNPHDILLNVPPPQAPRYQSPPNVAGPGQHPNSAFERLRAQRRHSRENSGSAPPLTFTSPPVPEHRDAQGRIWGRELGYSNSTASNTTPGADNFGDQAAGGIAGIALGVADTRPRESGMEAMRNTPGYDPRQEQQGWGHREEEIYSAYDAQPAPYHGYDSTQQPMASPNNYQQPQTAPDHGYDSRQQPIAGPSSYQQPQPSPNHGYDARQPPIAGPSNYQQPQPSPYGQDFGRPASREQFSQGSLQPLGAAMMAPSTARSRSPHDYSSEHSYSDTPYNRYSRNLDPAMADFDPNSIADDGDDGLVYEQRSRGSMLSLGHNSDRNLAAGAAGGAAAGGVMGTLGGLMGRTVSGNRAAQPAYNPVNAGTAYDNAAGIYSPNKPEKSEWLKTQSTSRKKWKWVLGAILVLTILGGIAAAVAVPLLKNKNKSASSGGSGGSTSSGQSAGDDTSENGDLTKDSKEIKALMNNKNLHKVFPGMDYTPINTQYPDCLKWPPSQNNVTRDLAVLSQLTNIVRLYGTDCNQTEMVMHSIDALGLNGTIKVWLGVWQDTNTTTNARQLEQMYTILETYGPSSFEGVIVGNEVLFREDLTITALGTLLQTVRTNFTTLGYNLPVATSDLGDKWSATLAQSADYVMANVHPFFAGVPAEIAASWTWSFWQGADAGFKTDSTKNIISETGWPSKGGMDCGAATTCTNGSVAGIDEMNRFMDDWVCQALANGTNYFWFEAFDEPWKVTFDTPGKEWEDQWGLMDINRNLKPGVKIPDCGGKTVG